MNLIHYSKDPLTSVYSATQEGGRAARGDKPNGLWVSVEGEDDWLSWCRSEDFALDRLAVATSVILRPDAKVLHLDTPDRLVAFYQQYAVPHPLAAKLRSYWERHVIDWARVAIAHDAIIIAPYQWEHRLSMDMPWYYGWDCASGCIWNADAVERLISVSEATTSCI